MATPFVATPSGESRPKIDLRKALRLRLVLLVLAVVLPAGPALAAEPATVPETMGDGPAADAAPVVPEAASAAPEAAPAEDRPFRVAVFGDSLADGMWGAVYRALRRDDRFEVLRRTRNASGLARPDFYDWFAALDRHIAEDSIDAAIVVFGLNDTQPVFFEGRWDHAFATPRWDEIYGIRVADFMTRLRQAGIPTFWLGLPVVRRDSHAGQVRHLNQLYESLAGEHGVVFVPTWTLSTDDDGRFSTYLPDDRGRSRQMRANDGVHFTMAGYEMLTAHLLRTMGHHLTIFQTDVAHE